MTSPRTQVLGVGGEGLLRERRAGDGAALVARPLSDLLRVDAAEAEVAAGDEDDVRVALLAHHAHRREARVERPVQQVVVPSNTSDDVETTKK